MCYFGVIIAIHFQYSNLIEIIIEYMRKNRQYILPNSYEYGIKNMIMTREYSEFCFKKVFILDRPYHHDILIALINYALKQNNLEMIKHLIPITKKKFGDVYQGNVETVKKYYDMISSDSNSIII